MNLTWRYIKRIIKNINNYEVMSEKILQRLAVRPFMVVRILRPSR